MVQTTLKTLMIAGALTALSANTTRAAQLYMWEDEKGAHASNNRREVPSQVLQKYDAEEGDTKPVNSEKIAAAQSESRDDNSIKFRGMRWGSSISEYPAMTLVEDDGSKKYYIRPSDKLSINDASLQKIVYGFYKSRLSSVIVEFQGYLNYSNIMAALKEKYSEPFQDNPYLKSYYWCLSCPAIVSLDYKEVTGKGRIFYSYQPIANEKMQDDIQRAKRAGNDL